METENYPSTENHPNVTQRQESDRLRIATIIQRGHIGHKTSDEIAKDVILHVNRTLAPDRIIQSLTHIHP